MKRALILSGGGARGAFQIGVWKYLQEINWKPDIICGTSVGAINAVGIGCGMSYEDLERLWKTYSRRRMYKMTVKKFFLTFLSRRKFSPLMDTSPLKELLTNHVNIDALRKSKIEIIISTLNMLTSCVEYISQRDIEISHIMAASAMPMLFPWQNIMGKHYWDAGLMVNTPIMPAIEYGAKSIIVVSLSPVGIFNTPLPRTHLQTVELIFEQFLIGSYLVIRSLIPKDVNITNIAPPQMLGLYSVLNFCPRQAESLIKQGYDAARKGLRNIR